MDCLVCNNDNVKSVVIIRTLRQVSMALELLHNYCIQAGNLDASYRAAEFAVLLSWRYLCSYNGKLGKRKNEASECFNEIWLQYLSTAEAYINKIAPAVCERYQLMLACRPNTEIDANKRVFDLIGRLASYGESVLLYYHILCKSVKKISDKDTEPFKALLRKISDFLVSLIKNNPTAEVPLEDSYSFEIGASACFLVQMGQGEFVKGWINAIQLSAMHNLRFKRGFPYHGLQYLDMIARASSGYSSEDESAIPKSSTVYPMLMLIASANGWADIYETGKTLHEQLLPKVDYQLWYPQDDSIDGLIDGVLRYTPHGLSQTSLDMSNEQKFRNAVFDECDKSPLKFGFIGGPYAGLLFIACSLSRYPLPPHYLRAIWDELNAKVQS